MVVLIKSGFWREEKELHHVKVRFAPSPTGPLHIGGARSALFNYLFAKHEKGELVLRIEDTDLERSRREYEEEIIASLQWLGISWDEGIASAGENGPYRQTERLTTYQSHIDTLLEQGDAYYCFCSEEELEAQRQELIAQGETPRYLGNCRHLSEAEREVKLASGLRPAVRFRVPEHRIYVVDDLVRDRVSFESDGIGDFIILKSDGLPTYNFAVVIDDVTMGITHVIRAEEHLSNTPRQLMIYEALHFKRPSFAHISLILGSDRQKMSKRHGATSLIQYREMGYLPEALFNFLALLGWSPEGEEQLLSQDELIAAFTLERVAKSPAVFDIDKLNWMNQQYIKRLEIVDLAKMVRPFLLASPFAAAIEALSTETYQLIVTTVRDHLVCLSDIVKEVAVLFEPVHYEAEALEYLQSEGIETVLQAFLENLPEEFTPENVKQQLKTTTKSLKLKPKDVFMPVRCALSGRMHGPDLPSLIAIWGRDETQQRIRKVMISRG